MTFLEQRLDKRITQGATVRVNNPGRVKIYTESGRLTQKFTMSAPRHEMDVSHGLRSAADFHTVRDLWFVVHFTPYSGFRVRIENDYIATQLNSKASFILGSTTVLQLQRAHVFGGITMLRNIYKPVSDTVVVYRTRGGSTSSIASTVDYETGSATISGNSGGDTYTWAGEFDVPMTFTDNEWSGSMEVNAQNLHISSDPIKLEEILL
jgi:uncharacterized protein (TIGR02217 family)